MKEKLKTAIIWTLLAGYLVTVLWIVGDETEKVRVDAISVRISDNSNNKFITETDVRQAIERENVKLIGSLMDSVNIHLLEDILIHNNKSISRAEVYRTVYGEIGVNVEQRRPIMRIINPNGDSYYIDANGQVMPLSKKYTAHVIVVNGNLNEPYMDHVGENLKRQQLKSDQTTGELLPDLFKLVYFINSSRFWKAQIEQIYINSKGDIELVPRVGNHTIVLGTIDNMREKFENLEAFYEQGLAKYGWNKYKTINLKFKNQIVCTKPNSLYKKDLGMEQQNENIVAAIDVGTTKIVALVGQKDSEGHIEVIGYGRTESKGVRRGAVLNIEETIKSIKSAVEQAEATSGYKITEAYKVSLFFFSGHTVRFAES